MVVVLVVLIENNLFHKVKLFTPPLYPGMLKFEYDNKIFEKKGFYQ